MLCCSNINMWILLWLDPLLIDVTFTILGNTTWVETWKKKNLVSNFFKRLYQHRWWKILLLTILFHAIMFCMLILLLVLEDFKKIVIEHIQLLVNNLNSRFLHIFSFTIACLFNLNSSSSWCYKEKEKYKGLAW
jgi:hypothetical protein